MKSKKGNNKFSILIAVFTIIIAIAAIFTFAPMKFGTTTYTGVWGNIGISSDVYNGLYAEYNITSDSSNAQIVESMGIIKNTLQEQGYQSANVLSLDGKKIRVEIGYPTSATNSLNKAYSALSNVAIGALELRSSTSDDAVKINAHDHIKNVKVADYNGTTYLVMEFNEIGKDQFKKVCDANSTVYVYMGTSLQTSFSVSNISDYSQIQLSVANYDSAKDFYYKAMFGSLSITLYNDSSLSNINTMSSVLSLGTMAPFSTLFIILVSIIGTVLIAGFVYMILKYKMAGVLLLPIMILNAIIAFWIFAGISIVEINVATLIAIILAITLIFTSSAQYMHRIAEEYEQGKTIDASIEAGTKKARPAQIVSNILFVVLFAILSLLIKGVVASASIVLVVAGALNALTNILVLPWFINMFNKTNKKQGKPFGLTQKEESANE